MAYSTCQQWRQRCGSNSKTTTTAAEKTWIGGNEWAAEKRQQDGSDSNGSGANPDLWQRLWQDGSSIFDNMVTERTWLGSSVRNRNGSGETAATVATQTWFRKIQPQQRQRELLN